MQKLKEYEIIKIVKLVCENSYLKFKQNGYLVNYPFSANLLGGNFGLFLIKIIIGILKTVT